MSGVVEETNAVRIYAYGRSWLNLGMIGVFGLAGGPFFASEAMVDNQGIEIISIPPCASPIVNALKRALSAPPTKNKASLPPEERAQKSLPKPAKKLSKVG